MTDHPPDEPTRPENQGGAPDEPAADAAQPGAGPDEPTGRPAADPDAPTVEQGGPEDPKSDFATSAAGPTAGPGAGPSAGPGEEPRRLRRSRDDRVFAGVSGGLGRYFAVDPILFRLAFIVLTVAGGAGLVAYLAAWVLMPLAGGPASAPESPSPERSRAVTIVLAGLLVLLLMPFFGGSLFEFGPPLAFLALVGFIGYVIWRAVGGGGGSKRALLGAGVALLVFAACVAGVAAVATAATLGAGPVIAGLIIVTGVAMAIGAFLGGARWLIVPALVMAIPLAVVAAADIDVEGPVGERFHHPATLSQLQGGYDLGIGDLRVDLRDLDFPTGRTDVDLDVGVGNVTVLVPEDVCVGSRLDIGVGHASVLGRENAGLDVLVEETTPPIDRDMPHLVIVADVGMGNVEVHSSDDLLAGGRGFAGRELRHGWNWDGSGERQLECTEEAA
jgi:phage shock protein PspC (stress-responsive transcriptional regulator)